MPHNKKHHYVSRFYLKRFGENQNRTINILNFKNSRIILAGNLKDQCYKNYLYGRDQACEKTLSIVESQAAELLATMTNLRFVPVRMTEHYLFLLVFVLFQKNRTLSAGQELTEQMARVHLEFFVHSAAPEAAKLGISREELKGTEFSYELPERAALAYTIQGLPYLFDLNLKVLKNTSSLEFVTSDNPVVFYNLLAINSQRQEGSATGFNSKGLQIFFPISSKHALFYYDSGTYKLGDRRKSVVPIDEDDVRSLNFLQLINALENIYFQSTAMAPYVQKEAARALAKRTPEKSSVRTLASNDRTDLIRISKKDITHRVALNFCKLREQPPAVWDPMTIGGRCPEMPRTCRRFLDEVRQGKWKSTKFGHFMESLKDWVK